MVKDTVTKLTEAGAIVEEVSIPLHAKGKAQADIPWRYVHEDSRERYWQTDQQTHGQIYICYILYYASCTFSFVGALDHFILLCVLFTITLSKGVHSKVSFILCFFLYVLMRTE